MGLGWPGLKYLSVAPGSEACKSPPLTWPAASLCTDAGPDLIAALHFLTRHSSMCMNLGYVPDLNHLAWNAAKRALKSSRLWGHQLLMLLNFIMRHGPFSQSARLQQCREGWQEYLQLAEPSRCPLYIDLLPKLLRDRHRLSEASREGIAEELWEELNQSQAWERAGTPVNLNRWFALIAEGREDDRYWHERYLAQLYTCIECDLMHGKKFKEMLAAKDSRPIRMDVEGIEGEKNMMKDQTAEGRSLKNSCANLLVVSTMARSDPHNQDVERMVFTIMEPLESWTRGANVELRSAEASLPWVEKQLVEGCFFDMLNATWKHMRSWGSLSSFGFMTGSMGMEAQLAAPTAAADQAISDRLHGEVVVQEEFAAQLGDLCLSIALEVTQSWLWMLIGWPQRAVLWLGPGAEAEISQFLRDASHFEKLQARVLDGATEHKELVDRSIFKLMPVQQLLQALRQTGGAVTQDLRQFLQHKFARFMQSQVAEDGFNICRKVETLAQNKKAPVQTLCMTMFSDGLLAKRHHFCEVEGSYTSHRMGFTSFPDDAFEASMQRPPGDPVYSDIASASAKTDWWKCKSHSLPAVYADLALLRMLYEDTAFTAQDLSSRWMSMLLRGNQLVKRLSKPVAAGAADTWYFAMGDSLGSACLLWPAVQHCLPGCPAATYFIPAVLDKPVFSVVVNMQDWVSWPYCWRSPLWQWLEHPAARLAGAEVFQEVRAFVATPSPRTLLESAASAGFWDIGVTSLRALQSKLGFESGGDQKLFAVLLSLILGCLGCSKDKALNIISVRLGRMGCNKAVGAAELLALDDGLELFTPEDKKQIEDEQRAQRNSEDSFQDLLVDLRLARQRLSPLAKASHVKHIDLPGVLVQAEVRDYCPSESRIWKNNVHAGWHGHCPPFRRISATVAAEGSEHAAATTVLKSLWLQHCHLHGCTLVDTCFVRGLFTDAELAAAGPSCGQPDAHPPASQAGAELVPSRGAGRGRGRGRGSGVGEASSSSRAGGAASTAPAAIGLGSRGGSRGRGPQGPMWK